MSPPKMLVMTFARYWNSERREAPAMARTTDTRCAIRSISPSLDHGVPERAPPEPLNDDDQDASPEQLQRQRRPDRAGGGLAHVDRDRHIGDGLEREQLNGEPQHIRHEPERDQRPGGEVANQAIHHLETGHLQRPEADQADQHVQLHGDDPGEQEAASVSDTGSGGGGRLQLAHHEGHRKRDQHHRQHADHVARCGGDELAGIPDRTAEIEADLPLADTNLDVTRHFGPQHIKLQVGDGEINQHLVDADTVDLGLAGICRLPNDGQQVDRDSGHGQADKDVEAEHVVPADSGPDQLDPCRDVRADRHDLTSPASTISRTTPSRSGSTMEISETGCVAITAEMRSVTGSTSGSKRITRRASPRSTISAPGTSSWIRSVSRSSSSPDARVTSSIR